MLVLQIQVHVSFQYQLISYRDAHPGAGPRIPHLAPHVLIGHRLCELHDAPNIAEVAREAQAYAYNTELATHALLERGKRGVGWERRHRLAQPKQRRGAPGVAHASRTQGYVVPRGGILDERVGNHVPIRLTDCVSQKD